MKLKFGAPLSNFAFKLNLCRYILEFASEVGRSRRNRGGGERGKLEMSGQSLLTTISSLFNMTDLSSGMPEGPLIFVLRKAAEGGALDAVAAALVAANTRTRTGENCGSSSSTASPSSAYDDASDMQILCWILRHFSDIPDLAKALAQRDDAARILMAASANVARFDETGAANCGVRVPGGVV